MVNVSPTTLLPNCLPSCSWGSPCWLFKQGYNSGTQSCIKLYGRSTYGVKTSNMIYLQLSGACECLQEVNNHLIKHSTLLQFTALHQSWHRGLISHYGGQGHF